jgi:hypothetical protein
MVRGADELRYPPREGGDMTSGKSKNESECEEESPARTKGSMKSTTTERSAVKATCFQKCHRRIFADDGNDSDGILGFTLFSLFPTVDVSLDAWATTGATSFSLDTRGIIDGM